MKSPRLKDATIASYSLPAAPGGRAPAVAAPWPKSSQLYIYIYTFIYMHAGSTFVKLWIAASRTLGVYAPWAPQGIKKVCEIVKSCLIPSGYCLRMADRMPGHEDSFVSSQFTFSLHVLSFWRSTYICSRIAFVCVHFPGGICQPIYVAVAL